MNTVEYLASHPLLLTVVLVTLIPASAMAIASFTRKNAALTHAILCAALLTTFSFPMFWIVMCLSGFGIHVPSSSVGHEKQTPIFRENYMDNLEFVLANRDEYPTENTVADSELSNEGDASHEPFITATNPSHKKTTSLWLQKARDFTFRGVLFIWANVGMFLLLNLVWASLKLKKLLQESTGFDRYSYSHELQMAAKNIGETEFPTVAISSKIVCPTAVGFGRDGVVLLPLNLLDSVTSSQLVQILTHEGAHIKRRDTLIQLVQKIHSAIWWWNPATWILNQKLDQAREDICDNFVLSNLESVEYGDTLLRLSTFSIPNKRLGMVNFFGSGYRLEKRIQSMLDPERQKRTRTNGFTLTLIWAVLFLITIPCAALRTSTNDHLLPVSVEHDPGGTQRDLKSDSVASKKLVAFRPLPSTDRAYQHLERAGALIRRNTQFAGKADGPVITIMLKDCELTDDVIRSLHAFYGLRCLILHRIKVNDEQAKQFQKMPSLNVLWIGDASEISDLGASHLAKCTSLARLILKNSRITDRGARELTKLRALQTLDLSGSNVTDDFMPSLNSLSLLAELRLNRTSTNGSGLKKLKLERLRHLEVSYSHFSNDSLSHLHRFPRLNYINLRGTKITDAGMKCLGELKFLHKQHKSWPGWNQFILDIGYNAISHNGFALLGEMNGLRLLGVEGTRISDTNLYQIAKMRHLKILNFDKSRFSKNALAFLAKNRPDLQAVSSDDCDGVKYSEIIVSFHGVPVYSQ